MVLLKALHHFDADGCGELTPSAFKSALQMFNQTLDAPLATNQLEQMVKSLPRSEDGSINYEDFLEAFEVVDLHQFQHQHDFTA